MAIPAPTGLPRPEDLLLTVAAAASLGIDDLPESEGVRARLRLLAVRLSAGAGPVSPALLIGAATMQACLHGVIAAYDAQEPGALERARDRVGDAALAAFSSRFRLGALDSGGDARLAALLVVSALRDNPALAHLAALWADPAASEVEDVVAGGMGAERYLDAEEPTVSGAGLTLPGALRAPAAASADSLDEQLAFVAETFGRFLPRSLVRAALLSRDLLAEERTARFGGHGPFEAPSFDGPPPEEDAAAAFSEDRDWMPGVVLVAKQAFVWLDQLSRAYGRSITRLDEVPDAELELLAARGFNALWLIGLWERSAASKEIKRRCGNPEAEASAYALFDYVISERLGGEDAWRVLRDRASARGIRLASDMVPNHVGIDGRWVVEHPDWFVQLPEPPYPGYRFDGPDLSSDERVGVFLEDGYWSQSDAAVVFKHVDRRTGQQRFIYHGNDGTQMPWNDTAQLNYLSPEVREAVIQTILAVARRFPIIRFDAAMTLAAKHVRRLWHPAPGSGGAIPSRSEHAVSDADFAAAMPREFWKEVVERVAEEVPDTLLLAEAFWMMEGYFVRTLGMHRVYNSAFMHMLRDEDTAGFRGMLKEVLVYSPGILERFVNFMNNPDEDTAAEQFGKGDKYFGVATLMATLPGLPMFGHGQVEGFEEKYGMEYARAYKDERPDTGFVEHHERVIFPLLRRRALFAGVEHFALYDFVRGDGGVDENVLAFSNRDGAERSLVLFNNAFEGTAGRIRLGAPVNTASPDEEPCLHTRGLAEALELRVDEGVFHGLRELRDGLWFLRSGRKLTDEGLFAELGGYRAQVFMDWRELRGARWAALAEHLGGRGVPDLDAALDELFPPSAPLAEGADAAAGHEAVAQAAGQQEAGEARGQLVDRSGDHEMPAPQVL